MNLIDLRKSSTVLNTYKGFAGGITGIACSMDNPYVASVSLDRYLRIHHIDTKELLKKVISSCFFFPKHDKTLEKFLIRILSYITDLLNIKINVFGNEIRFLYRNKK